ncbi:hypothetical protein Cfor_06252, partial [Coptotermes formosanus]
CVQQNKFYCFDTMVNIVKNRIKLHQRVKRDVTVHLRELQNSFEGYFAPNNMDNNWLRNAFVDSFQMEDCSVNEYEQSIDNASDSVLKQKNPTTSLSSFWASLTKEYPDIP